MSDVLFKAPDAVSSLQKNSLLQIVGGLQQIAAHNNYRMAVVLAWQAIPYCLPVSWRIKFTSAWRYGVPSGCSTS